MQLTNPVFVFICLPVGFLLLRLLPAPTKKYALLILSCLLLAWGSPRDALFVLSGAVFNFFTAKELALFRDSGRTGPARAVFVSGVLVNLAFLLFFKYTKFALGVFGLPVPAAFPDAPLGISFFTFSALSYLADVFRGDETPGSFADAALYLTFFPKFLSGPIVQYREFSVDPARTSENTEEGFTRFVIGLGKKLILSDALSGVFAGISARSPAELSAVEAWLGVLLYALLLYYDFSGYSDMAIGLGLLAGARFRENFDYPYLSDGITDFWRRWHISLGRWFRDYVYIPLGGSRRGTPRTIRNLLLVWLLTGLWHGAGWTFPVWGLYHFLLLLAEKYIFRRVRDKLPRPLRVALTFLLVAVGWVPFFSASLPYAGGYLISMAGFGAGFCGEQALFLLRESALWLIPALLFATPLARNAGQKLKTTRAGRLAIAACLAAVLVLSAAAMIGGTARSFLYAQF